MSDKKYEYESLEEMLTKGTPPAQDANMSVPPPTYEKTVVEKDGVIKSQDINVEGGLMEAPGSDIPKMKPMYRTGYEAATAFDDPKIARYAPTASSRGAKMAGAVAPDFSGYDSLLAKINAAAPKPMHWAEMLGEAIPVAVGAKYGLAGQALGNAGNSITARQTELRKRDDEFQKMLLELEAKRAAQMAKGVKGTKVSGDREATLERKYIDQWGNTRRKDSQDESGNWLKSNTDEIIVPAPTVLRKERQANGRDVDHLTQGPMGVKFGERSPKLQSFTTGKGEHGLENPYNGFQHVNPNSSKTQIDASPKATTEKNKVVGKYTSDTTRKKIVEGHGQVIRGLDGLALGTKGGAKTAVKMAIQNLEPGGRMSEGDFKYIANDTLGLMRDLEAKINKMADGAEIPEDVRKEINDILVLADEAYRRDMHTTNEQYKTLTKSAMGSEYTDKQLDYLQQLPKYDSNIQGKNAKKIIGKAGSMDTKPVQKVQVHDNEGKVMTQGFMKTFIETDPVTGKQKKVLKWVRETDG
jgi:hypothetical protein